MTERKRILRVLQQQGDHGTTQGDWLLPDVIDGAKPITRLAARIGELEAEGFIIGRSGKRGRFLVYVLGLEDRKRSLFDRPVRRVEHPEHPALVTYMGPEGMSQDELVAHIARVVFARARVNLSEAA